MPDHATEEGGRLLCVAPKNSHRLTVPFRMQQDGLPLKLNSPHRDMATLHESPNLRVQFSWCLGIHDQQKISATFGVDVDNLRIDERESLGIDPDSIQPFAVKGERSRPKSFRQWMPSQRQEPLARWRVHLGKIVGGAAQLVETGR